MAECNRERRPAPWRRCRLGLPLLLLIVAAGACRATPAPAPTLTPPASATATELPRSTPTAVALFTATAAPAPSSTTPPLTPTSHPASALRTATAATAALLATPVDLAGKVASDLPGTPLTLGATVTSLIGSAGKRRDVYALPLSAGGTLEVDAGANRSDYSVLLLPPGATSVVRTLGQFQGSTLCSFEQRCHQAAPIGVAGAYTLVVEAAGPGVRYTLHTMVQ